MSDSPFGQVGFIHRILDVGDIFKFYLVMITPSYSLVFMHEHALAQVNMYPSRFLLTCCRALQAIFGLLLLILAIYKATEYWKTSTGFNGFHLVRVIVQDQLLYYLL